MFVVYVYNKDTVKLTGYTVFITLFRKTITGIDTVHVKYIETDIIIGLCTRSVFMLSIYML